MQRKRFTTIVEEKMNKKELRDRINSILLNNSNEKDFIKLANLIAHEIEINSIGLEKLNEDIIKKD